MPELEGRMLRLLNKKKGRIAAHEEALNAFEAGGDAMDGPISPMSHNEARWAGSTT